MTEASKNLLQRVISGLVGLGILVAIWIFGGPQGLHALCTIAIVMATHEYSRMAFRHWQMPPMITGFYWIVCALLYAAMVYSPVYSLVSFGVANALFLSGGLWISRDKVSNENLLAALALGVFGILYCVAFPYFITRTLWLEAGPYWFLFLLIVVFFGDIFAYIGGRLFGKRKLMVSVSPKKTWEGSVGGLMGSAVSGVIFVLICLPTVSPLKTLLFCIVCGIAAQSGDLLMSLVKRVAQVKDSGKIMPGHGGILDRLDGIFIACPLVYAYALYSGPF